MNKQRIIHQLAKIIRAKYERDGSGHDWYHIERVWRISKYIAVKEINANVFIVELAALCHELGDYKLERDGKDRHEERTREVLGKLKVSSDVMDTVLHIVCNMSYSKNIAKTQRLSLEGKIVQDADRLEALGAIGISRTFAYAGSKGNLIYDPKIKPKSISQLSKVYKKAESTSINHFYEKLLLLKDKMNTKTAKRIALRRHKFMEQFLKEFYLEWELKDLF